MTYLLVASGGLVCITDASKGCPDWPACHGRLIPPAQMDAIIEYSHRLGAALTLALLLAAAIVALRHYRAVPLIVRSACGAIVGLFVVAGFGAASVYWGLSRGAAAADLGAALLTLALVVTAAVTVALAQGKVAGGVRDARNLAFARLVRATLATVFVVLVSGVLVAPSGSIVRCIGWPGVQLLLAPSAEPLHWPQLARLGLALVADLLVLMLTLRAWRTQRQRPLLRGDLAAAAVLLLGANVIAALVPAPDPGVIAPVALLVTTEAHWAFLVAASVRASAMVDRAPGAGERR